MDVVVPIAASDPEFEASGYRLPKPLIEVRGKPMIEWATAPVEWVESSCFVFVVLREHVEQFEIGSRLRDIYGENIRIVVLDEMTEGAAETVLAAREYLSTEPLIVLFGDQHIQAPVQHAIEHTDADGMIATFEAAEPKWSYAKTDTDGRVIEVAEKKVISSSATAGLYYFVAGTDFIQGVERMIEKDVSTNGLFYICPVYNELLQMGKNIEVFEVEDMRSLGDPAAVELFEKQAVDR